MQQCNLLHKENINVTSTDSVICCKILCNVDIFKYHNKMISFSREQRNRTPFQRDFLSSGESVLENKKLSSQQRLRLEAAMHCHAVEAFEFIYLNTPGNSFLKHFVLL